MKLRFVCALSVLAAVLHAIWEFVQCVPFYADGRFPMTLAGMLQAVTGDVALTWLMFWATTLALRRPLGETAAVSRAGLAALAAIGAILATAIELHALSSGRWRYSALMPIVPGIGVGLLPLLQLMVLPALALRLAQRWMTSRP
ncbi:MAG: hypothetical protein WC809_14710 [Sinimarinibacterium sp.]